MASTQNKKGREYKEVSRLAEEHPKEEKRRRLLLCLLTASTSSLTAPALGEKPPLLALPQHRAGRDARAGDQLEVSE